MCIPSEPVKMYVSCLQNYLGSRRNPPPIVAVLDVAAPRWRGVDVAAQYLNETARRREARVKDQGLLTSEIQLSYDIEALGYRR